MVEFIDAKDDNAALVLIGKRRKRIVQPRRAAAGG